MKTLYRVKSFGRYYFFTTIESRDNFLETLDEAARKHCELDTILLRGDKK